MYPKDGELIYDHYSRTNVEINKRIAKNYVYGIVDFCIDTRRETLGWFLKVLKENIYVIVPEMDGPILAINKNIFGDLLYFNNINGFYTVKKRDTKIEGDISLLKGNGSFPYIISRAYDAESNIKQFKDLDDVKIKYSDKYKKLLKYTFGIEYETNSGYIPQDECFANGLIPLRDGSISGIEYATVVMTGKDGIERVERQIDVLNKYTTFDKNCSLHLHFGKFPVSSDAIMSLYILATLVQRDLQPYLPKYSFSTRNYKSSGKDYCKPLSSNYPTFSDFYTFISDGTAAYAGSLVEKHPRDPEKESKWNVRSRYHWVNFVNMCFYKGPKTVEFRMLRPTHNFNKIIFWIFFFNAMMLYAEKLAERIGQMKNLHIYVRRNYRGLIQMLSEVYPKELVDKMSDTLDKLKYIVDCQERARDLIGEMTEFEDSVLVTSILE